MRASLIPILAAICITAPVAAHAKTIHNTSELMSSLATAKGGETFYLSPGDYGNISIKNMNFAHNVTIKSIDAANPARFGQTSLNASSGISFEAVTFSNPLKAGANPWDPTVNVINSNNILFSQVSVHGSKDNNPTNDGYGIVARGSSKVLIKDSQFTELVRAIVMDNGNDIAIKNNRIFDVQSEGINFSGIQGGQIIGNSIKSFHPQPGDHPDAIQIFTLNSKQQTKDIVISNNMIVGDPGRQMQGIFVTTQDGSPYYYDNITISNNLLVGTTWHGVTLQNAINSSVTGNVVYTLDGQPFTSARIQIVNVEGVLSGNIAKAYILKEIDALKQAGNLTNGFDLSEAEKAIAAWELSLKTTPGGLGTWDDPLILPEKPNDGFGSTDPNDPFLPGQYEQVVDIFPFDESPDGYDPFDTSLGGQSGQGSVMSAVPEPATWAQLLFGFGVVGWLMRRGRPRSRIAVQ